MLEINASASVKCVAITGAKADAIPDAASMTTAISRTGRSPMRSARRPKTNAPIIGRAPRPRTVRRLDATCDHASHVVSLDARRTVG
jgi:hypothetical protein